MKQYWFRPKKFWKVFACYVPTSHQGWVVVGIEVVFLGILAWFLLQTATTQWSFWCMFVPWILFALAFFDLLCFRFGEYPSWWRKK